MRDEHRGAVVKEVGPVQSLAVVVFALLLVGGWSLLLGMASAADGEVSQVQRTSVIDWTGWVKDVATIVALLAGGYWFYRRREKYPRMNLTLQATLDSADQQRQLARVCVRLENVGKVMAKLVCAEVWLQQLDPRPARALDSVERMQETIYDDSGPSAEALWPLVGKRVLRFAEGQREIEPGEQDEIWFDFLVDETVCSALAYVHIENVAKSRSPFTWWRRRDIGWNATKVVKRGGEINERQEGISKGAAQGSAT